MNAGATLEPATISFGEIAAAALPISRTLNITNTGTAAGDVHVSVQQRDADSNASLTVTPTSVTFARGRSTGSVTVRLSGTRPRAGSYEGFIVVSGGGTTLRLPYLYMVGDSVPADVFPIHNGSFTGGVGDSGLGRRVLRAGGSVRRAGAWRAGAVRVTQGGGKIAARRRPQTFRLGISAAPG